MPTKATTDPETKYDLAVFEVKGNALIYLGKLENQALHLPRDEGFLDIARAKLVGIQVKRDTIMRMATLLGATVVS